MNVKRLVLLLLCIASLSMVAMTGCKKDGKDKEKYDPELISERWAFSHERDKAVMIFFKDGTAAFDGVMYKSYEMTDSFIRFTAEDGTVTEMRFYEGKDFDGEEKRYVYRKAYYKLVPDLLTGDSPVIGYWAGYGPNEGLSFQFTDKGTFYEDETLPGHYFVNDDGSILLNYDGYLSNTLIYYTIDGDMMTVDYPWAMVKMP
jgi:hypothetical protein